MSDKGHSVRILFERFIRDECGATAIEYALIAGTLSIAILIAVTNLGTTLNTTFTNVATGLK
jgi:pilus assembly protein Flp/PilA